MRNALGWAAGTRFIAQMANWALTLATIRFLQPEEYGLMAMTVAITGLVQAFGSAGFGDAIVQRRDIGETELRSVFGLILLVNAACLAALCVLAYPAAYFYGEPRLVPLIQVSSLLFVVIAFQTIPRATLDKRLDMKTVSQIELLSNVISGVLVLGLAAAGLGVWALIIGLLFGSFFRLAAFNYAAPFFLPPRFAFREVSGILRAGWLRSGEGILWYAYSSADVFIIGKLLGPDILGIYSVARNLAALPIDKLASVVKPVVFPAFAKIQNDQATALVYLQKALRLLAFLTLPVFFGISAVAPWITGVVLGPKWHDAILPLAILALAMALRPVGLILYTFLIGIGQFGASFKNTVFASILFPTAFLIGSHWGLLGVCTAWLVVYPLYFFSLLRRVALVANTSMMTLIQPLLPPLVGSLTMYIAVGGMATALPTDIDQVEGLLFLAASGAAIYLGYSLFLMRGMFVEVLSFARR
ncbi:MAG: lipopolysaccharide biosynthesis protein [Alphaproteobacteria bacterium]